MNNLTPTLTVLGYFCIIPTLEWYRYYEKIYFYLIKNVPIFLNARSTGMTLNLICYTADGCGISWVMFE